MKQFSKSVVTSTPYSPFNWFNRQLAWRLGDIDSGFLQDMQRGAQVINRASRRDTNFAAITAEQTLLPVSDPVRRDRVIHAAQAISTIDRQLVVTDASHVHAPRHPTGGEVVNLRFARAVG